jgi:hypothetical protein
LIDLHKILFHFDREYIFKHNIQGFGTVSDLIHDLTRQIFLRFPEKLDTILNQIHIEINLFRCEQETSMSCLSILFKFLESLNFYDEKLEPMILQQAVDFYSEISHQFKLPAFLEWFKHAFERENQLVEQGLRLSTLELMKKVIRKVSLEDNTGLLFGDEFKEAIAARNFDMLRLIYSFFDSKEMHGIFDTHFGGYFSTKVNKLLENLTVVSLIEAYNSAKEFAGQCFDDPRLLSVVRDAFSQSMAQKASDIAKQLAAKIGRGTPITDDEIEFFKLNSSKDVFEAAYSYMLKKRILSWIPVDVQREKFLIDQLKGIAGSEYTDRLELMIRDVVTSQEIQYKTDNFEPMILSYEVFGKDSIDEAIFPDDVKVHMNICAEKFKKGQSRMIIQWSSTLSTVRMRINDRECVMSADQALILMAICQGNYSVTEISVATGINREAVQDNLLVMKKREAGEIVVSEGDVFAINENVKFKGDGVVSFPSVQAALAERERIAMESNVEIARAHSIQCAIVQKLKVFRQLELSNLYPMIQKGLKFPIDMKAFLSQLKELEVKGYIEKFGDKSYKYLA